MPSPQLMGDVPFPHDNRNPMPIGRRVQFHELPARMQTGAYSQPSGSFQLQQLDQYQEPDVFMRDRSFSFDNAAPSITADDEWESTSPKPALPVDAQDAPKPKKTRRRKPKAPLDQETAQKKRREALDKNKQAAAKCRARKKADENKRQQELQIMKSENVMLLSVLHSMEEQVRRAKSEVDSAHPDCKDESLMKARKLIETIQASCEAANARRQTLHLEPMHMRNGNEEDDMMSGAGEQDGFGDFEPSHTNAGSRSGGDKSLGEHQEFQNATDSSNSEDPIATLGLQGGIVQFGNTNTSRNSENSNAGTELQDRRFQFEFNASPFMSNPSDVIDYGTSSKEPTANPLWVATHNLPKEDDSLFNTAVSAGSFDSMLSSPANMNSQLRGGGTSSYPDLPSPANGFPADMPLFDPADPVLGSNVLDQNLTTNVPLFEEFEFDIPQPRDPTDKMDPADIDMLTQMDSAYDSQSPRSSQGSKHSSPTWESLKLQRSQLDPCLRRDSALGPEVNEEQLLRDLSLNKAGNGYSMGNDRRLSLFERRAMRPGRISK